MTNPNGTPLTATAINPDTSGLITPTTSNPSCPASNMTVNAQTGLAVDVPAGTSDVTIPDGFKLSSSAPTACQGATITVPAKLTFSTK